MSRVPRISSQILRFRRKTLAITDHEIARSISRKNKNLSLAILLVNLTLFSFQYVYAQEQFLFYQIIKNDWANIPEITGGVVSSAQGDNGAENINLPFEFTYMGETYNTARISVNGWMEMGQSFTAPGYINQLESTIQKPFIAPLWDDLYADEQTEIRYETIGDFPARMFIVQWKNVRWNMNTSVRKTFKIRLWEIDGTIDLSYGPGTFGSSFNVSFSIGLNNHIGGANNFISITPSENYMPVISDTNANNSISSFVGIGDGLAYSFVPQPYPNDKLALNYQTMDTVRIGGINQKVLSVIVPCHAGAVLTPPWVTKLIFDTHNTTNTDDLISAKLFCTYTSSTFNTGFQLGETVLNPDDEFSIGNFSVYLACDNVTYFWLAFDISSNADPGNIVDARCLVVEREDCCFSLIPDTTYSTAYSVISQPLQPEVITVGSGGTYQSLSQAFSSLQTTEINSSIIIELTDGYQPDSEIFPIYIPYLEGSSQDNILTIRPSLNSSPIQYSSSDSTIIIFNNSKYVTIDGRPGGIGSSKMITFINTSLNNNTIKYLDGAQFNTLQFCNVLGSDTSSNGAIIYWEYNNYSGGMSTNNIVSDCIISNSTARLPKQSIKLFKAGYYSRYGSNNKILNCDINGFTRSGIEINRNPFTVVSGNKIYNGSSVESNFLTGIFNYSSASVINGNKIYNLNSSLAQENLIFGIYRSGYGSEKITNNFISLSGNQYSSVCGIYLFGELYRNAVVYNNSIKIAGSGLNTGNSYCIRQGYSTDETISLLYNTQIKNNLFINKRIGGMNNLAISIPEINSVAGLDYNNYFIDSSNNHIGQWGNQYANDLQAWQSITGRDLHSISKNIEFVSTNDLHLSGNSLGDLDLISTTVPFVTKDIDGELRHHQYPYMGADENLDFPLPVEMLGFSGKAYKDGILLNWSTASEQNCYGFSIDRKSGENSYKNIGFIKGSGTKSENSFYSFYDAVSSGRYYYRLTQIDFNGASTLCGELETYVSESLSFDLAQNYPNPFNPSTTIKYSIAKPGLVTLKVYDILGREIAALVNEVKTAGSYEVSFKASNLSSGMYLYKLTAGSYTKTHKMILLK